MKTGVFNVHANNYSVSVVTGRAGGHGEVYKGGL